MHVRELEIRYRPTTVHVDNRKTLNTPRQLAEFLTKLLARECVEVFLIVCLSTKHRVICVHEVSRGSLDATVVHPREVFKAAALASAASIVLAHNHPSGDPAPSTDDIVLTTRMVNAGDIMGIPVLDHIVVGESSYYSFVEAGRLCRPSPT
jgi:DNA repair protein RadC